MVVRVNNVVVGSANVDPSGWHDYTFPYTGSGGLLPISVAFDNDYYNPPWNRDLHVDKVTIDCP